MAYSRMTKVMAGALGAGIIGIGCYHTGKRMRQHFSQHEETKNIEIKQSDMSEINLDTAHFQRTIRVGLSAAKFVYDFFENLSRGNEEPPEGGDNDRAVEHHAANQIVPQDPGAGGDAGDNEPARPQRREYGGGDAPQFFQPIVVWGEDAPPPF